MAACRLACGTVAFTVGVLTLGGVDGWVVVPVGPWLPELIGFLGVLDERARYYEEKRKLAAVAG